VRIISNFHDYYDVAQGLGQDRSLIYFRTPQEDHKSRWPFPVCHAISRRYDYDRAVYIAEFIIGFCGRIYPMLHLKTVSSSAEVKKYCYKIEDVDRFVGSHFAKGRRELYWSKARGRSYGRNYGRRREIFIRYFTECTEQMDGHKKLFVDNGAPLFVAQLTMVGQKIVYNSSLKEVEFYRIFSPYVAFQEISMYLGGIAQPERSVPKVSDADLAAAKGFDKWSFRKPAL